MKQIFLPSRLSLHCIVSLWTARVKKNSIMKTSRNNSSLVKFSKKKKEINFVTSIYIL